jgi:hypothetical protein
LHRVGISDKGRDIVPCSDCQSDCCLLSLKRIHSPRCNASSMMSFPVRPLPPIIRSLIFDEIYPRSVSGEVHEERALDCCKSEKFQESCDPVLRWNYAIMSSKRQRRVSGGYMSRNGKVSLLHSTIFLRIRHPGPDPFRPIDHFHLPRRFIDVSLPEIQSKIPQLGHRIPAPTFGILEPSPIGLTPAPLLDRLDMGFRVGIVTWSTGRAMQHLRLFC